VANMSEARMDAHIHGACASQLCEPLLQSLQLLPSGTALDSLQHLPGASPAAGALRRVQLGSMQAGAACGRRGKRSAKTRHGASVLLLKSNLRI